MADFPEDHRPGKRTYPCQCGQEHIVCEKCGYLWPCPVALGIEGSTDD